VLSLTDAAVAAPPALLAAANGDFTAAAEIRQDTEGERISAIRLYNLLASGEYHPRAVILGTPANGLWAWTAATVSTTQDNTLLDISISFPVNETHYMLVRGVRPFSRVQLYGTDYRTDPQFERYDSSGWSYSASEQTLLLKMKHRSEVEHVLVFYGETVQTAAPSAPAVPAGESAANRETAEGGT
jgi:hypothetical protein